MVIYTVLMKPGVIESSQSKARTRSFQKKITNVVTVMAECPSYDRRDPNSANICRTSDVGQPRWTVSDKIDIVWDPDC